MKPFAWSWSKLKNYRTCPKRHWHVDIAKDVKEPESDALMWGNRVHDALAKRIKMGTKLPKEMAHYERWVTQVEGLRPEMNVRVEQDLAMDRDFNSTTYFAPNVWFRAKIDMLALNTDAGFAVAYDWKTGDKISYELEQLGLSAQTIFSAYPAVHTVATSFIWLGHDRMVDEVFERSQMLAFWNNMFPEVKQLELAHKTTDYPAKPGNLCRNWCPVKSCPHNGKYNQ